MNFFNFTREDLMQEPTIKKIVESEHIDNIEIIEWNNFGCHEFVSLGVPHPDYYNILATSDTENLSLDLDCWELVNDINLDLNSNIYDCATLRNENYEAEINIDYQILNQDDYIEFTYTNTCDEPTENEPQATLIIIIDYRKWEKC